MGLRAAAQIAVYKGLREAVSRYEVIFFGIVSVTPYTVLFALARITLRIATVDDVLVFALLGCSVRSGRWNWGDGLAGAA